MRLGISSYAVLCAVVSAGAVVVACSSDDGGKVTPVDRDAGPPETGPDTNAPDMGVPEVGPDAPKDLWTDAEIAAMNTLSPLPAVPADPTNAFANNALAAVLGQRLFFDKSYSGALTIGSNGTNGSPGAVGETGKVGCISCHSSKATDDNRSKPNNVSLGTAYGTRNALSIVNASFYTWTNWGGRFDSQWSLPPAVAENVATMKSTRLQIAHLLWDKYKDDYNAIFPVPLDADLDPAGANPARFPAVGKPKAAGGVDGPWEGMDPLDQPIVNRIFANFGKAIAAYMRLEVSRNAPFDKLVIAVNGGDKNVVGAEMRGLRVFLGKGQCIQCHSGPNFADGKFNNIGVEQTGPNVPATDFGRYQDVPGLLTSPFNTNGAYSDDVNTGKLTGLAQVEDQRGRFRTKSLRGLSNAAPYMHAGQLAKLEDVVNYYSTGGTSSDAGAKDTRIKPLGLSAGEASDLVAFLKTLDGDPLPLALTTDTSR